MSDWSVKNLEVGDEVVVLRSVGRPPLLARVQRVTTREVVVLDTHYRHSDGHQVGDRGFRVLNELAEPTPELRAEVRKARLVTAITTVLRTVEARLKDLSLEELEAMHAYLSGMGKEKADG